ncbi:MAG: hypothetical protein OXH11_17025 [Candidatus Aminicenantes bacterium]|nr:hypothetical protein [Candidatus Aminicenantes bacterium]
MKQRALIEYPRIDGKYGKRWSSSEEEEAVREYKLGIPVEEVAARLGRSILATRTRIYFATGRWKHRSKKHVPHRG